MTQCSTRPRNKLGSRVYDISDANPTNEVGGDLRSDVH